MAKLFINVKFSSSSSCPLEISTDSSIRELKSLISGKTGIPVADVNLIFAGKLLQNGQLVSELGLGNHTVLHAFQQKRSPLEVRAHIGLNQLSPKGPASVVHPHQFYVYCKECAALQPGKLRVVCEKCHQGKIILHQEPGSFDDVLQQGRIQGDCQNCGPQQKAKFYFKCTKDHSDLEELQGQCAVLRHIKPNRRNKECITCTDVQHPVLSFPCNKKHLICMECFLSYCVTQLNERRFVEDPGAGYSLPCPAGCPDSLIKDPHHFCLLGTEQYERYKSFAAEEYLLQNGGLMCPALGCGAGLLLEELSQKVICPSCRFEFCRECRDAYHPEEECNTHHTAGASGQEVDNSLEQAMRAHNELESMETIDKISKPCPKCRVKTERSGGCMHMTCSVCKTDWCWICDKEWNRDCQGNHWFG
ncbi:E3 ubiquitin-protein ligase parkin-like isoform X2 [Ostrea edulis]|uniref:E3 ubiquitin-protein ligase parkin-like isoform X2 n=1 Tax=Ostrea edulis TaxID=37623 RepID=UPI0024AFE8F7|nr:E3 ubiquitin-protein ligase parkin-like isoform X2 [Ostrea edulis]